MSKVANKNSKGHKVVIIDKPYTVLAVHVEANSERLCIQLKTGMEVVIPTLKLGKPWIGASEQQLANVRLGMGGSWLWWDDLEEGFVLEEVLPSYLGLNPASMLARKARGRRASPTKAAAARRNGAKGGRPRTRR